MTNNTTSGNVTYTYPKTIVWEVLLSSLLLVVFVVLVYSVIVGGSYIPKRRGGPPMVESLAVGFALFWSVWRLFFSIRSVEVQGQTLVFKTLVQKRIFSLTDLQDVTVRQLANNHSGTVTASSTMNYYVTFLDVKGKRHELYLSGTQGTELVEQLVS